MSGLELAPDSRGRAGKLMARLLTQLRHIRRL